MLNLLQDIFGGSQTQSQATSTPENLTPAPYAALQQPLANALSSNLTNGLPAYSGPTLNTNLNANENTDLTNLQNSVAPTSAANNLINNTINGQYLNSNPNLQAAITAAQTPTIQALTNTLSTTLPGQFTQAGQFVQPNGSSAFDRAAALASQSAGNALGNIASTMSSQDYQNERTLQQGAVGLSQSQVSTAISNLQAQTLPTMIQQMGVTNALQLFQTNTNALLQLLQTIGGVAAPVIANATQSTSTGDSTGNAFTSLFGGGTTKATGS